ncbi:MAG: hypothetical protein ACYCO0_01200 [Candidatus Micrarchaeaceae archaeon]
METKGPSPHRKSNVRLKLPEPVTSLMYVAAYKFAWQAKTNERRAQIYHNFEKSAQRLGHHNLAKIFALDALYWEREQAKENPGKAAQ